MQEMPGAKLAVRNMAASVFIRLAFALTAGLASTPVLSQGFADWYPADITPPPGTQYPCALKALPRALSGVSPGDRQFINHTYSMILKMVQAKTLMLASLYRGGDLQPAYSRYYRETWAARKKILDEPAPRGLEKFKKQMIEAVDFQLGFFARAVQLKGSGRSLPEIMRIAEGHAASDRLLSAWMEMSQRYPAWTPDLKDSIYHHLCALDLF